MAVGLAVIAAAMATTAAPVECVCSAEVQASTTECVAVMAAVVVAAVVVLETEWPYAKNKTYPVHKNANTVHCTAKLFRPAYHFPIDIALH